MFPQPVTPKTKLFWVLLLEHVSVASTLLSSPCSRQCSELGLVVHDIAQAPLQQADANREHSPDRERHPHRRQVAADDFTNLPRIRMCHRRMYCIVNYQQQQEWTGGYVVGGGCGVEVCFRFAKTRYFSEGMTFVIFMFLRGTI